VVGSIRTLVAKRVKPVTAIMVRLPIRVAGGMKDRSFMQGDGFEGMVIRQ
jgi:hypothetical protein